MSRNDYTRTVRKRECRQIERQEQELRILARELRCTCTEFPILPVINEPKERRRVRLEHNRRHKPKRPNATPDQT
jgi:hypothetical protein